MRTSPVHYIAPSAISIIPNANGSQRDLAVNVDRNAKIKVCYQPIADLAYDNANYKEWTLRGRNRRLADADVPYTIYARLKKNDRTDGYLVFAQQIQDEVTSEWHDPYILTPNTSTTNPMRAEGADGEKYLWAAIPDRQATQNRTAYWWVKLGTVSQANSSGNRSVDLDTGILGTDQYNVDWYLDPDKMPEKPLRVVYVERGEWTDAPTVVYTGTTGEMKPDGTLDADTAMTLGWTGTKTLSFKQGQTISEPYHYRHLTRCRWLTHRLAEYNNGYTDQELFERLNKPTRGWEEENWVETSRVWRNGKLWECLTEGATDEPSQESPNWKLLLQGGEDAVNVELTKSADAVVIDPSGNIVGGYRTVSKDSSQNEFYTYRFFTSATVMRGGGYLHLCGAMDDNEELGEGNYTIEAVGAGCDLKVEGSTVYITSIWHCNDGDAGTDPYTSYNRTPEEYQLMRAMTEAVAHITLNIEGKTAVTKDYRLQLVHLPTDTITLESHNEVAALNWSTKRNAWTNIQDIVIPLTASSGGQPVMFQTVNGGTAPDIRLLDKPGWLSGTPGYSVAWADYDEDGDGHAEYTASQHMSVEITIPIANILRTWQENNTTQEIPTTNLLKFNVTTIVDGVEYENVVPFTLNVTTDKAIYVLAPSVRQVTGTMIGGTWDPQTNTVSNARYSYVAAGEACNEVTCRLMCYDQNDNLTEIESASAIHDNLTFFINGQASTLEGFRTTGVQNTTVAGKDHNLFDELSEIVFAIKMDGRDYESEGVPILRNGANLSIGDDGNWYIGGVNTEVFAKGTTVTGTFIYYTDPMDASTPPAYSPATNADRGNPVSPYLRTACPASVDGKFIHYVSITVFSDSEETYVYSYGTIGSGNTITVIHDRDFYASASELTQAQLRAIANASWSESTPSDYSSVNKYLYGRDTARYYKNGVEQTITVGGISYPHIVYIMLSYWGQDGSGVEFAYYRAADDSIDNKPTVDVLNQRHAGTAKNPVIADWNGSDGGWYDDNPGFTTQGQVMYQSVNQYSSGTWSGWGDPVIIDRYAEDGTDGKYEEKQFCRSAAATSANGSTAPTNIDTSYGSEGWSETPPIPTRQYPFIWQRTRTIDPNTNTATSWVYVRLTGEAGEDGAAGKAGLWYAYAGIWGQGGLNSVTNTETQGWYVQHNGSWYMNVKDAGSANTTTPGSGVDGWADMSSAFKFYIAEAYFGNYAHLGSFIINGDWMISQYGTLYDSSGTAITVGAGNYQTSYSGKVPYAWFDPAYPTSNKTGSYNFCPNFAVDGKTGKTYQQDAYIKGEVHATSGVIGGIVLGPDAWGGATLGENGIGFNPDYFFLKGAYGFVEMSPYASTRVYGASTCVLKAVLANDVDAPAIWAVGNSYRINEANNPSNGYAIYAEGDVFVDGDIQLTGTLLDANGQPIGGGTGGHNFNTNQFTIDSNNTVSLRDSFSVGGTITANDFALSSDERKKNIVELINLSVKKIAQARIVLFKWKDKSLGEHINGGLIAQDWLSIAPWAVPEGDDGFLGVRYSQLAAVMGVECAREIVKLQEENEALKEELKSVKSEVKSLRDEVAELRAMVKSMVEGK